MTGPLHGALLIATNPADEIAEIWEEIVALAVGGGLVALAAFGLIFVAVTRTLAPVSALAEGLARLARGERSLRVPRGGSPELVAIADGINALAASLARLDEEHHRLLRRMIHVQEDERRDIARDLHDEIGPFLFAIRAGVGALRRKAASNGFEPDCARIDAQIAALQQVNRRVLARLRPAALEELGLAGALAVLAAGWRESHPRERGDARCRGSPLGRRDRARRLSDRAGGADQRAAPLRRRSCDDSRRGRGAGASFASASPTTARG